MNSHSENQVENSSSETLAADPRCSLPVDGGRCAGLEGHEGDCYANARERATPRSYVEVVSDLTTELRPALELCAAAMNEIEVHAKGITPATEEDGAWQLHASLSELAGALAFAKTKTREACTSVEREWMRRFSKGLYGKPTTSEPLQVDSKLHLRATHTDGLLDGARVLASVVEGQFGLGDVPPRLVKAMQDALDDLERSRHAALEALVDHAHAKLGGRRGA